MGATKGTLTGANAPRLRVMRPDRSAKVRDRNAELKFKWVCYATGAAMKITRTTDTPRAERAQPSTGSAARSTGAATQPAASGTGDSGRVQLSALSSRLNEL
jgi:hypothetical protein